MADQPTTQTELVFETEEAKAEQLASLQDRIESEPDNTEIAAEIQRISEAKVQPKEGEEQPPEEPQAEEPEVPPQEPEPSQEVEPSQEEQPPETPVQEQAPQKPSWFPKEFVPKETYTDPETGEEKPIWTYDDPKTGPERLVKTLVHSQRRIRKLEAQQNQVFNEGYEKAKAEFEKKLEEAKKTTPPAQTQTPSQLAPPLQHQAISGGPQVTNAQIIALEDQLKKVGNTESEDYDVTEHAKVQQQLLVAQRQYYDGQIRALSTKTEEAVTTAKTWQEKQEEARRAKEEEDARKQREKEAETAFEKTCKDIDTFASAQKLNTGGKTFQQMDREADIFHGKLAQAMTGKYQVTSQDKINAETMFLREDPLTMDRMKEAGLQAPASYDAWNELTQIDAMRNGYYLNPSTMRWEERKDMRFPDMETAADYYAKITGKTKNQVRQAQVQGARKITSVLNKRDTGVVTMDESLTQGGSEGDEITQDQATQILENTDMEEAILAYRQGNKTPFDNINKARARWNMPPLDPTDIQT